MIKERDAQHKTTSKCSTKGPKISLYRILTLKSDYTTSARWIPHLLKADQKEACVTFAKCSSSSSTMAHWMEKIVTGESEAEKKMSFGSVLKMNPQIAKVLWGCGDVENKHNFWGKKSISFKWICGKRSKVTSWAMRSKVMCQMKMFSVYFLTRQKIVLGVQKLLNVSNPNLLDVDIGGLQGETLWWPATRQDELTGIVVHTVFQTQEGYLWGRQEQL